MWLLLILFTLRPKEPKWPVKVTKQVGEQELTAHVPLPHPPDSAQMSPLQGDFPSPRDTPFVSLTAPVTPQGDMHMTYLLSDGCLSLLLNGEGHEDRDARSVSVQYLAHGVAGGWVMSA